MEAYEEICSNLKKLCPRLVPSPLWGYSLASFSRVDPGLGEVFCEGCDQVLKEIHDFWFSLPRERCIVCKGIGNEIDEDWNYFVEGGKGRASLTSIRTLCPSCHLAKHQGYAKVIGESEKAMKHLAEINGVKDVRFLVSRAFSIHFNLSQVKDWKFSLDALREPLRSKAENILNTAYSRGLKPDGGWLFYISREPSGSIEDNSTLLRKKTDEEMLSIAREEMKGEVNVMEKEFILFVKELRKKLDAPLYEIEEDLIGKWMVFVKREVYGSFFSTVIKQLEKERLAYEAKVDTNLMGEELPVIVYVESSLDFKKILKVKDLIAKVMEEFQVKKGIYFKPDLFTSKGIYRGGKLKPYIYYVYPYKFTSF